MPDTARTGRLRNLSDEPAALKAGIAAASAAGGGLLALTATTRPLSLTLLAVSGATSIALTLIYVLSAQTPDLLWALMYTQMVRALVRQGIERIDEVEDIHRLMTGLRDSVAGLHNCEYDPHSPIPESRPSAHGSRIELT